MKDLSLTLSICIALSFLAQIAMALSALGRMVYLGWRANGKSAGNFLRSAIIAGLPSLLTTVCFLGILLTMEPLWPAQDETPEQQATYQIARDNADYYYRLAGSANIFAGLWSLALLRKAWKRHA